MDFDLNYPCNRSATSAHAHAHVVVRLRAWIAPTVLLALLALLVPYHPAHAQADKAEHESHHPGAAASGSGKTPAEIKPAPAATPIASTAPDTASMPTMPQAPASPASAPAGMQGDMGAMGKMMEGMMGGGARKEIYPFLMGLPAWTPEKSAEAQRLSEQRISEGSILLQTAQEDLSNAIMVGDHAAAQHALQRSREGIGQVGSGVATYKLLREGTSPQNVASQWFKREMSLPTPVTHVGARSVLDVSPFHLFTMAVLVAFALAMVVMYFFKMRRTAALFGRIESGAGAPPPGASPPLAGGPSPLSPPGGAPPTGAGAPSSPGPAPPAKSATAAPPVSTPSAAGVSQIVDLTSEAPATAKWRGQLRVGHIITETPSVRTLRLQPADGDSVMPFTFLPGQFLNVALSIGGARMNRSYSISSSPTQRDFVDLTVKREPRGAVSRHIDDLLKVGDQIEAGGPVGRFTFDGTEADSIVLIAGGVGITPMMSIARYLTAKAWRGDIFFIYACRSPADFIFANDVAALERVNPKLHVTVVMERPEGTDWQGPRGRLTKELLAQTVPDIAARRIHICGPPVMMDAVKTLLSELKVPADQVKTEDFGTAAPIPGAAGTTARFTAPATGPLVTFSKNNKSSRIHVDQTVLELSEEIDIGIEFACRVGTCGICKVKLISGEVEMAVQDGLDADDKAASMILACQAKPTGPVAVEA